MQYDDSMRHAHVWDDGLRDYGVILADPPWTYNDKANAGSRGAGHKYSLMTMEELFELRVDQIAADNCLLALWATAPLLDEAMQLINSWGFIYRTVGFVWVKLSRTGLNRLADFDPPQPVDLLPQISDAQRIGMGHYSRGNAEFVLFATIGRPKIESRKVRQVIFSIPGRHSEKPPEAHCRLEELTGDVRRLELFGRRPVGGWDVWGLDLGIDVQDRIPA